MPYRPVISGLLALLALLCFIAAAFGFQADQILLVPAGLAFFVGAFLVGPHP